MPRLVAINPKSAQGRTKELLDAVQAELGMTPNIHRTMANAPAALESYLAINAALERGSLPASLREQIALTVAELHGCDYCLAAHTAVGRIVGLSAEAVGDARRGESPNPRIDAALTFARAVVLKRGQVEASNLAALRAAGFDDEAITEIVAAVALATFANYLTLVAETDVDFPELRTSAPTERKTA